MDLTFELARKIGDKLNVNWNAISPDTLAKGARVEMEHEDLFPTPGETLENWVIACKIAHTHLKERPDYYVQLADMERSPVMQRKPEKPLTKPEYKKVIETMVEEVLNEIHYPPKALDANKVKNPDRFWEWPLREVSEEVGLHPIGQGAKTIGDIILWMNMAIQEWERKQK